MNNTLAVAIVGLMLTSVATQADPSGTVNKFMDTPASLFSIGMMRVDEEVSKSVRDMKANTGERYYGSASFDWDKNQIILDVKRYAIKGDQPDFDAECKEVVENVRMGGMVMDGKPIRGEASYYSALFLPVGYSIGAITEDDAKNLDQLSVIHFSIFSPKYPMKCSAPLIGTGYSIEKQ